jgi:tetratricopeptide (TPR) repeat protein
MGRGHGWCMRYWLMKVLLAGVVMVSPALAEETKAKDAPKELSTVEESIPAAVKALGAPAMMNFPNGIKMAVSAATDQAQAHVLQGLNHLHGGWEFEASRHFAAAMKGDPECLLAHWGMVMALLNPSPETSEARNAATDRMCALIERGNGTELERGYAYGLVKYIEEGPAGAAAAFRKVAEKFPNEMQAGVFAALFSRGGYDAAGEPTPDQLAAEKNLLALIAKNPQSPVPLNALLFIRAEATQPSSSLELARGLCQMAPDYPPFFHLLGHYEWRCGNHGAAASAFGRASSFYQKWMKDNKAGIADCPEWAKAECYRIVSLVSKGDFDTAYAAARQVASTPIPKDRPASPGARFLLWDVKTLPARILFHRGLPGNASEAAASLPKPDEARAQLKHSLAYWWIDGLRIALDAQRLMDGGNFTEARQVVDALTLHGENMAKIQQAATATGERSSWLRSFRALEVLASDVRGRLAMAGPKDKRGTAYNWFASAADRQLPETLLNPPMILTPMAARLGGFFLTEKRYDDSIEAYQRALATFPNDMNSLVGLKSAYQAAGKTKETTETAVRIEKLKAQ